MSTQRDALKAKHLTRNCEAEKTVFKTLFKSSSSLWTLCSNARVKITSQTESQLFMFSVSKRTGGHEHHFSHYMMSRILTFQSQNYDIHTWQKHQHAAPLRHKLGPRPGLVPVKMWGEQVWVKAEEPLLRETLMLLASFMKALADHIRQCSSVLTTKGRQGGRPGNRLGLFHCTACKTHICKSFPGDADAILQKPKI